jgi:hypothetical protein
MLTTRQVKSVIRLALRGARAVNRVDRRNTACHGVAATGDKLQWVTKRDYRDCVWSEKLRSEGRLWQVRLPHQVAITLTRGATAFIDRPHHQALAAPAIAGGEHTAHVGGELAMLGLCVGTWVALNAELCEDDFFRSRENPWRATLDRLSGICPNRAPAWE